MKPQLFMVVAVLLSVGRPLFAQNHIPLEITNPRAIGAAPQFDPDHRAFRACTGVTYTFYPAVIGGRYPYAFDLSGAPEGMTIDQVSGVITWLNPRQSDSSITLTVLDAGSTSSSLTFGITVTSDGCQFVDAVNGRPHPAGDGSQQAPWRSVADVTANGRADAITYFRGGVYHLTGLPIVNANTSAARVEIVESVSGVIWLAYPGEVPTLDLGASGAPYPPAIRMTGNNVYVDGFEVVRSRIMAFQVVHLGQHGATFVNNNMHDHGPGEDGANAAFIAFTQNYSRPAYGVNIQRNRFHRTTAGSGNSCLKLYSLNKALIANNEFFDLEPDPSGEACIAIKAEVPAFTVRANAAANLGVPFAGGNMHGCSGCGPAGADVLVTGGEILFNNVKSTITHALDLNQDSQARAVWVYRNTLQSVLGSRLRDVDADDGPFQWTNNVIINGDDRQTPFPFFRWQVRSASGSWSGTADPSRVSLIGNLTGGRESHVDADGQLIGPSRSYLGVRGFQIGPNERPLPRSR